MSDPHSLVSKIAQDLEKSGFASELTARKMVQYHSGHWNCYGIMSFFDLDEERVRQVDLYAVNPRSVRLAPCNHSHTVWSIVAEVKKSEAPWVVFKERRDIAWDFVLQFKSQLSCYAGYPSEESKGEELFLGECYDSARDWIGCGIHESFKKPTEASRVHSACITVAKAAEHFHKIHTDLLSDRARTTTDIQAESPRVHVVKPVIILDGPLFAAEVDLAGNLVVEEIKMAPIHFSFRSPKYDRGDYRIDLVRLTALHDYLDGMEAQHAEIERRILDIGGVGHLNEEELANGAKGRGLQPRQSSSG